MRTSFTIALPVAQPNYDVASERILRRYIEQTFQDLRGDVVDIQDIRSKPASLSLRRHQFLLMGAASG
jgi:hypothetical protein